MTVTLCIPKLARQNLPFTRLLVLVIRLSRTGRTKVPTYRMLVAEKSAAVKGGKFVDIVGNFAPAQNPVELKYDKDKILAWVSKGACPSETLARILYKDGMKEMIKFYDPNRKFNIKSKKAPKTAPATAAATAAPVEPTSEAPKEASADAEQAPAQNEGA